MLVIENGRMWAAYVDTTCLWSRSLVAPSGDLEVMGELARMFKLELVDANEHEDSGEKGAEVSKRTLAG